MWCRSSFYGRDVHEILQKAAGLHLTGMNAEVAPAQWEFQFVVGIEADDLILLPVANRVLERSHLYMDLGQTKGRLEFGATSITATL